MDKAVGWGAVRGACAGSTARCKNRCTAIFDVFSHKFVSRLLCQVVRTTAGAELDLVGALGGQHICSGLDNKGMPVEVVGEACLVHADRPTN